MDDSILFVGYTFIGIVLRIGIPLALTFGLGWYLRKLDAKWRAEGVEAKRKAISIPDMILNIQPCWEANECLATDDCPAYNQTEKFCWEIFQMNGDVQEKCENCEYRRQTISVPAGVKARLN